MYNCCIVACVWCTCLYCTCDFVHVDMVDVHTVHVCIILCTLCMCTRFTVYNLHVLFMYRAFVLCICTSIIHLHSALCMCCTSILFILVGILLVYFSRVYCTCVFCIARVHCTCINVYLLLCIPVLWMSDLPVLYVVYVVFGPCTDSICVRYPWVVSDTPVSDTQAVSDVR